MDGAGKEIRSGSVEYSANVRSDRRPREGRRVRGGLISARRRAAVAVRTAVPVGARSPRGPIGRPGESDAHADVPPRGRGASR